jgi:hypothetical protein
VIGEGGGLTWNLTWNLRSGASSLASTLEYRVSDFLHGTEFATRDKSGLVSFAVGNDVQPSGRLG